MWTLLEKKETKELRQLFAESCEKLQETLGGHELSSDEISELNSRKYADKIKDADEKVKINKLPVVEAIASLKYIINKLEHRIVSSRF